METNDITLVAIERAVDANDVRLLARYSTTLYVALLRSLVKINKLEK